MESPHLSQLRYCAAWITSGRASRRSIRIMVTFVGRANCTCRRRKVWRNSGETASHLLRLSALFRFSKGSRSATWTARALASSPGAAAAMALLPSSSSERVRSCKVWTDVNRRCTRLVREDTHLPCCTLDSGVCVHNHALQLLWPDMGSARPKPFRPSKRLEVISRALAALENTLFDEDGSNQREVGLQRDTPVSRSE